MRAATRRVPQSAFIPLLAQSASDLDPQANILEERDLQDELQRKKDQVDGNQDDVDD